ncbi:MAG: exported protein of unknown function [Nitrospira sp.]|nr:exported protein of unknown function [Nitrospira sp.]
MRTVGFCVGVLACSSTFLLGATTGLWAEDPPGPPFGDRRAVGVVMGVAGGSVSIVSTGPSSRIAKAGDLIVAGEEIHAGVGARVDLLWDHRALLTLHDEARMGIQELHHGQTELRLHHGSVRIALSYNAGRMTDRLTLQTPFARMVSRGGIMEATVMGGESRSFFARLINTPPVETLRVFEGQARVEPLTEEGTPFSLKAGSEISLKPGRAPSVSEIRQSQRLTEPLVVSEEHRGLPHPIMRQIANAHVGLALEEEKELQQTARAKHEKELPGMAAKGAILSISTGLPFIPGTLQAAAVGNSTGGPSPSMSPPVLSPSVAAPIQGAGAGIGSAQSGGLNTSGLLQQILNDVGKGAKGRGKK